MTDGVTLTVSDGIASVTLDGPGGNRLSWRTMTALRDIASELEPRDDVRAVLLRGAGRDFSRGADLTDADLAERMRTDDGRPVARAGRELLDAWSALPQPTVVALRGWVVGGGLGLALACDLRVAAADARLALPEVDRAMHLGWGIVPRLVAAFGSHTASWLALTGDPVSANELRAGGLRLEGDPIGAAQAVARDLASKPPLAVRAIKATLREARDVAMPAADADVERFAATVVSHDFGEAIAAFFEKRVPRYDGR